MFLGSLASAATVTVSDGRALPFVRLESKGDQVLIHGEKGVTPVAFGDILKIDFDGVAGDVLERAGQQVVITDDGSVCALASGQIADGKLNGRAAFGATVSIPQERILHWLRSRSQERPAALASRIVALKLQRTAKDAVVISKTPDQWVAVPGIVISTDDKVVRFRYEGAETLFESATVPIIIMAKVNEPQGRILGQLVTAEGSRLGFTALEFAPKELLLSSPALGRIAVPLSAASSVRLANAKMSYLSDLEPQEVRQSGFFDERFAPRKDACVAGGPLRLNGVTYAKGLGLHSRCEVSYHLGGEYRAFNALAGIDDSGLGAAFLKLLADGKTVFPRLRLECGKPPQPLRLELAGVQRLTLQVDFGEDGFGAGERVDLVEPTLLK